MKKVLVTGGNGQLGSELKILAPQVDAQLTFIDKAELDLTDFSAIDAYFNKHSFDFVVNCAAYTLVDKAEEEQELSNIINGVLPGLLAQKTQASGGKFIHISTDFVFEGNGNTPLSETNPTHPLNVYGKTKLEGERAVQQATADFFIIRTSWLYSCFGNNFIKTILRLAENRDELGIIFDQIGTPTHAKDLARLVVKIIAEDSSASGIYHYSNEGSASWYDFAIAIKDLFGLNTKIKPINTSAYPTPATRPVFSVLDKSKVKEAFDIEIPHWYHALTECRSFFRK